MADRTFGKKEYMTYNEIPTTERAALRRRALFRVEVMWLGLFLSAVATSIALTVGVSIARETESAPIVRYIIIGIVFSGLWLVFQEAVIEPRIKKECERMKNT